MRWFYDQINCRSLGILVVVGLWFIAVLFVSAAGCSTLCRGSYDEDRRPGGFEITRPKAAEERKAMVENAQGISKEF